MFIMFPGIGVSKKGWDTDYNKNIKIKTNFISELKKMGSIYYHEPLYHNISYYTIKDQSKSLYDKNIDFTKKNFDVSKECECVYKNIKKFEGMFIPIGHSIGFYFVYCFQQKYPSKVLFSVIIDGSPLGPFSQTLNDAKYLYPNIDKYQKYDDTMINKLKDKLYKNDIKAHKKLFDIALYNIFKYKNTTNKAKKFNKPLIGFYNIDIKDTKKIKRQYFFNLERIKEIEYFTKNNNDYTAISFINKTHYPHFINDSKEIILKKIKEMIDKYN